MKFLTTPNIYASITQSGTDEQSTPKPDAKPEVTTQPTK